MTVGFRDIPTVPGKGKPGSKPVARKKTVISDTDRTHSQEPARGPVYALSDTSNGLSDDNGMPALHQFLKAARKVKRR